MREFHPLTGVHNQEVPAWEYFGSMGARYYGNSAKFSLVAPYALLIDRVLVSEELELIVTDVIYRTTESSGRRRAGCPLDLISEVGAPVEGSCLAWHMPGFPGAMSGDFLKPRYPTECLPEFPLLEKGDTFELWLASRIPQPMTAYPRLLARPAFRRDE